MRHHIPERLMLLILLASCIFSNAVELPKGVGEGQTEETETAPTASEIAEVSVLCYHDFSETGNATEMRIKSNVFADQMQQLADSGINVISLSEFEAWKSGQKKLPARNVLITIDDGWRSVYEEAFPILKKHKFPFAIGLYTDFIASGGKTLTLEMLNEMRQAGMEIACHSTSHPLPSKFKKARNAGADQYRAFLNKEIVESKKELDSRFRINTKTYIYPGGYYLQDMFPTIQEGGMSFAFTVKPGKVTLNSSNLELPRYVVLGTTERMFEQALKFTGAKAPPKKLPYAVKPGSQSVIAERRPWIGIDLSKAEDVDPNTVYMRVAGFGKVDAKFLKGTKRFEWQASRNLHQPSYSVLVQWRKKGSSKYEPPIKWEFYLDYEPHYLQLIK